MDEPASVEAALARLPPDLEQVGREGPEGRAPADDPLGLADHDLGARRVRDRQVGAGELEQGVDGEPGRHVAGQRADELGPHEIIPSPGEIAAVDGHASPDGVHDERRDDLVVVRLASSARLCRAYSSAACQSPRAIAMLARFARATIAVAPAPTPRPRRLREAASAASASPSSRWADPRSHRALARHGLTVPPRTPPAWRSRARRLGPRRPMIARSIARCDSNEAEPSPGGPANDGAVRDVRHAVRRVRAAVQEMDPARDDGERRMALEGLGRRNPAASGRACRSATVERRQGRRRHEPRVAFTVAARRWRA